jgi:SAM-dependent methyltransferase
MNPEERASTIERYADRLERLGPVVQALGWRDTAQQELRFRVMADGMTRIDGASVLDIGCGFGDLYGYLTRDGASISYTGCDISAQVLAVGRSRYPAARFEQRDVLEQPYAAGAFDYVCMSGIFNHRLADNELFLRRMLTAAFEMAAHGAVANMTTDHVDYQDAHLYYFNPERVLEFCRGLSRHVALRHDYPLYEFTIFTYRHASEKNKRG